MSETTVQCPCCSEEFIPSETRTRVAELEASLAAAWLHERDMRVAEAVREACIDAVAQSMRDGEGWSVDIAAVVAGVK